MYPGLVKSTGIVFAEKPSVGIEPTNLPDRSRFGNHGTHTDVTPVRLPNGLWVREFSGLSNSHVNIGSHASLLNLDRGPFSLEAWFYSFGVAPAPYQVVLGIGKQFFQLYTLNMQFYFWLYFTTAATIIVATGIDSISYNTWNHVVGTWDLTYGKVYLNGDLKDTTVDLSADSLVHFAGDRTVSRDTAYWMKGYIALPGIYNYALSAGRIKQRYESKRHWFGV
ncbi:hypothetical protein ES703_33355 [subsurface metagenome]